jgi:hypothetical protein
LFSSIQDATKFEQRLKYVYKYEVLGGQHTSTARAELHRKHPDNPLFGKILAEVYTGLTDDEALRLSSRHNVNGHFIHKMTHRDYVSGVLYFTALLCDHIYMPAKQNKCILVIYFRLKHADPNYL